MFVSGLKHKKQKEKISGEDGVTSIEFALVLPVFLLLLFGIIETSLVFTTQAVLDGAAYDAARVIRTGQAQKSGNAMGEFEAKLCSSLFSVVDCSELAYDVTVYPDFASVSAATLYDEDGNPLPGSFTPGIAGDIVVVTVGHRWEFMMPLLPQAFGRDALVITTTHVFRNEPFEVL